MSINKKLISAALAATTILWAVGAAALPLANAQTTTTTTDLQALIASLQQQIAQLTSQLNAQGGTTATTGSSYSFGTTDLTIGSKGAGVTVLQKFLIDQGYLKVVSAPTGYFGTATQKALASFQTAKGISPATGYYGPITRAYLAKYATSSTGTSTGTGTGTGTGSGTGVTAPATGLQVSLASSNPATGSLISSASAGSSRVPVLAVNLTAGNSGAVTVSSLAFQKTGVLSDSAISGAYLTQNGQVIAQYNSLNSGLITFSGLNLQIPAGQTMTVTLAVDISANLSAGNTAGFSIPSASDITAWSSSNTAVTPTGMFPMNGNTFTVTSVSNPSLATVTISSSSIGTQVTAGSQGNVVGAWNFNVANSPVYLQNLNFHVIGSANVANLQNVKLMVNGTQVGQTLSAVSSNGMADFSGNVKLNTGNNNVQVLADVMGSPSYNFQFEILNTYDVLAVDSQYNVPVSVTNNGGVGTQVSIQQGQITMTQDASTPTGNIAAGMSNVTLAKYDIYAAGEPVKVKYLDFNIAFTGATTTLSSMIQNVSLTDDAGNQVGTSINQPPSSNTCQNGNTGSGSAAANFTNKVYYDCFGTPSSPINYIVPANTSRVLSLKADIQSGAGFSTITANLTGNTSNLQGQISSQTGSTAAVNGVALTLVSSSLTAAQNNGLGSQSISAGASKVRIGSYSFSASSAEGVNVNTVSVKLEPSTTTNAFSNLQLYVNGVQFGTTQNGTLAGNTTYTFSGNQFNVPAGQTVNVDVYANTLSSATGTYNPATQLVGYTGSGATSYTSINYSGSAINGQQIAFSGQPALTVAADSNNPATVIAQNTSGNTLANFRFTETSNVESVKVNQFSVIDTVSTGTQANFSNLQLWANGQSLGTASAASSTGANTWAFSFTGLTGLVVPQGGSLTVTLKGDAGSYTGNSITDGSTSTFSISTSTVVAYGNTSNKLASVTGSASGAAQTVVRSFETVTGTPVSSLPPASYQQIGAVTIASNAQGDTLPKQIVLTFNSTATSTFLNSVNLKDQNGTAISGVASTTAYTVTFSIPTSYVVSAPTTSGNSGSYTFQVWGNLGNIPAIANTAQSLTAQIQNATDYSYYDGPSTSYTVLNLPTTSVPITVVNMTSPTSGQF